MTGRRLLIGAILAVFLVVTVAAALPTVAGTLVGAAWILANGIPSLSVQSPAGYPLSELVGVRDRGLGFLKSQYNPSLGLLRESPKIGYHNHYLANDNVLAAHVLELYGEKELAGVLRESLRRYGHEGNGFVEAALGRPIVWPPRHHLDVVVGEAGEDLLLQETHPGPGYFYDWSAYSNLAFMAAVNEQNLGHGESARRLYALQMAGFDGLGWQDKAWADRGGVYETIGLAWSVLAASRLGLPADPEVMRSLLRRQGPGGGFHTHFTAADAQLADPNVEATCLVLLAIAEAAR